jgi:hypothetical protein
MFGLSPRIPLRRSESDPAPELISCKCATRSLHTTLPLSYALQKQ